MKFIYCDTEYHTTFEFIDKVYCIAAVDDNGKAFKKWLNGHNPNIVDEILEYYDTNAEDAVIVCHAWDLAERRAFTFLGVDVLKYNVICTFHLAKMLLDHNFSSIKQDECKAILNDDEKLQQAIETKRKRESKLSYAALCKRFKLALIDTDHKEAMRKLCIEDKTEGHEQEILDYCLSDVTFLGPLFKSLMAIYNRHMCNTACIIKHKLIKSGEEENIKYIIDQCKTITLFGKIADRGLPIDINRLKHIAKVTPIIIKNAVETFLEKYPGCFKYDLKECRYKQDSKTTQKYLTEQLNRLNLLNKYPRTDSGSLNTSSDVLKEYFKQRGGFGEDLRQLKKLKDSLKYIRPENSAGNLLNYVKLVDDGYRLNYFTLNPYSTITTRCAPPTKRFIFGYHKALYGLLNPVKGKWLVELDYHSQETMVMASICKDENYYEAYKTPDIYLYVAYKAGYIPQADYEKITHNNVEEYKQKYKAIRSQFKTTTLGLQYGMGVARLAERLQISITNAEELVKSIRSIFKVSFAYRDRLIKVIDVHNSFCTYDMYIVPGRTYHNKATTVGNWPFQSGGSDVLRELVRILMPLEKEHKFEIITTIHDAIVFLVDEGNYEAIEFVKQNMVSVANKVLNVKSGYTIEVGEPDIIASGDIWSPDKDKAEQFKAFLKTEAI